MNQEKIRLVKNEKLTVKELVIFLRQLGEKKREQKK